ncbi:MAG: SOS response-associated peptidase [Anaeromyxobacter sp.]
MCGRFTLTTRDLAELARTWAAEVDAALAAGWRPRFNVAPGDPHPVLRAEAGRRRLVPAAFGLTGPAGLVINARAETAATRPTFREAWQGRRAVVPADGFFEWEGPPTARRPTWFHAPDGGPLLLAALLGPAPGGGDGFAIVTTAACPPVSRLHDRMPVILPPEALDAWLSGPPPALRPPRDGALAARPVSSRVNAVGNDDEGCLGPPEPPRQGSLF